MPVYKISEDAAREQLDALFEYYEIETDELPDAQKKATEAAGLKLLKAIRIGRLEIDLDDDDIIRIKQNIRNGEPLIYREIDGKAKVAMSRKDDGDAYGKAYAMMGSLCGLGETAIISLKSHDLSVVECLGMVFLQA